MATNQKVVYGKQKVELSRLYPFGARKKLEDGTEVTEVTINEPTGRDEVDVERVVDQDGYNPSYAMFAQISGNEYEDMLSLAQKDGVKIMEAIQNF